MATDGQGTAGLDPLATPGGKPAPSVLDAPLSTKNMVVNLGPSHPAMHGVTRAVVQLEGETIRGMKLDIGFLHRGFEKSCENVTWTQAFPYTDRLNYVSSIINNVGYALAAARCSGWEAAPRRGSPCRSSSAGCRCRLAWSRRA